MKEHTPIIDEQPDDIHLLEYIKGTASKEVKLKVENWLFVDNAHKTILHDLATIYFVDYTQERMKVWSPYTAFQTVKKKIERTKRQIFFRRLNTIAACLFFFILGGSIVYWTNAKEDTDQLITLKSNAGMRTQFDLPDGTKVHLNSGSQITYSPNFNKKEREVSISGEAYFEVEHRPSHPFVVHMIDDRMRVKVLGTTFNVRSYPGEQEIETTLVKGKVLLEMNDQNGKTKTKELHPSEKAIFNTLTGFYDIEKVETLQETGWIDGKLVFKNTPLPEVLKKIARFYNVKFNVKDSIINSYQFTGTFVNRQIPQILDYLKISSNIDYSINYATEDDSLDTNYNIINITKK